MKVQEMKQRVEASKAQHAEMLQRAQDICIEADEKAASMEKRATKAEARAVKAEAELSDTKSEGRRMASDLKVVFHLLYIDTILHCRWCHILTMAPNGLC